MAKRISAIFFLSAVFTVAGILLLRLTAGGAAEIELNLQTLVSGEFSGQMEAFSQENLPLNTLLEHLAIDFKIFGGAAEIDGVLVGETMLMKNVEEPDEEITAQNQQMIANFAQNSKQHTYLMLLPTACAIKQQELPESIALFNQRSFIDDVYNQLSGSVSVVDTYLKLLSGMEEYIYYRTQDNLTPMGGYLIYEQLGKRLGISPLRSIDQFDLDYSNREFYGNLYQQLPCRSIAPDRIVMYRFSKYRREYKVTHYRDGEQWTYYTLFPEFVTQMRPENSYDVVLGGLTPVTTLKSSVGNDNSLLIFADDTVLSYIPFLMVHYSNIAIVDVRNATPEDLETVSLEEYNQVLFGVSVDTFMHQDISPVIGYFLPEKAE